MSEQGELPSKAEMFAGLITGHAKFQGNAPTIQRSHRFPVFFFTQIENLARVGGVPISLVINQLIECGLEAIKQELPAELVGEMHSVSPAAVDRLRRTQEVKIKGRNSTAQKIKKAS